MTSKWADLPIEQRRQRWQAWLQVPAWAPVVFLMQTRGCGYSSAIEAVARASLLSPPGGRRGHLQHIEDGELIPVKVLAITPSRAGWQVDYEHEGYPRMALLPLPRPLGSDLLVAGSLVRLEVVENGRRILAVHPLVGRSEGAT